MFLPYARNNLYFLVKIMFSRVCLVLSYIFSKVTVRQEVLIFKITLAIRQHQHNVTSY